jgi:cobalt/nickel transport system ATP-binding protein
VNDADAAIPSTGALLRATGLRYRYLERFDALVDVSLSIDQGEQVAVLGANGSGKSTLLKVLAGLVHPDAGSYEAFGHEVTEDALEDEQFNLAFRSRVGVIFQNPDVQVFSPTVRDEIAFGPLNLGMPSGEIDARIDDVLTLLDIAELADRAPYQLSGGQKKRVAIASVLVTNPDVLLLDEPTAALDPRTQTWLVDLLTRLATAGKTIVLATHDLATLPRLAARSVVLGEDHRVLRDGSVDDVLGDRDLLAASNLIAS